MKPWNKNIPYWVSKIVFSTNFFQKKNKFFSSKITFKTDDLFNFFQELNRKKSFDSSSSSECSNSDDNLSIIDEGGVGSEDDDNDSDDQISYKLESGANENQDLIRKIQSQKLPTRVTLKLHITENTFSIWETVR